MSSIAKTNISLSKKDLTKSRIPPVGSRNVVFYHKATVGQLTISLLSLTMPSADMPTAVQATPDEISSARLSINKKNLNLVSSSKGDLIQGLDYIVVDSSTISLIGPYEGVGAESNEIFVGTINNAPISDLVVASARTVSRSYTLAVGQTTLNLAQEFQVNLFPSENIGIVKIFVNGILAYRNTGNSSTTLDKDYYEVDSGNGFGTTVIFNVAPVSVAHDIVVDFGVQAITDFNAIGTIESLGGTIKKIADDLAVVAGTTASDYYSASPSEVERRTFGDMVLVHDKILDIQVPIETDWISSGFTSASFTGFGTVSVFSLQYKRQGSDLLIKGYFTAGTTTNVEARLALPTWNSSQLISAGSSIIAALQLSGDAVVSTSSASYFRSAVLMEPSVSYVTFGSQLTSQTAFLKTTGTTGPYANQTITINARIPIEGWSATQSIRTILGI